MADFENARVFRPRLLVHGSAGMGQNYIAAAVLHHFEKVHVQSFALATLMGDATKSIEAAIVQSFVEVKRRKPSVIFIPEIEVWYSSLSEQALATFKGLLHSIPANEPILLFGVSGDDAGLDTQLLRDFFTYARKDRFELSKPDKVCNPCIFIIIWHYINGNMQEQRSRYFNGVISHIRKSPTDFPPDPANRKKRVLEELERVVPPPPRELTKEEIKAQEQKDRQIKNWLKLRLNPMMEAIKQKYRRFKKPVIEYDLIKHLLDPQPPPEVEVVVSDIPPQPPVHERFMICFEDADEQCKIRDTHTDKTYYNLDIDVIEERLSNGFYCTPKQFLKDLERIRYDADISGDKERKLKANEMLTNAEVFIADVEMDAGFVAQCEDMYRRQEKKKADKRAKQARKAKSLEEAHEAATRLVPSSNGRLSKSKTGSRGSPDNNESFSNGVNPPQIQPEFHQLDSVPHIEHDSQSSGHATGFQTPHSQMTSHMESPWSHFQSQGQSGPVSRAPTQLTMSSAPGASVGVTAFNASNGGTVIANYASTTTSGKRTSDGTNFNSQQRSVTHSHSNGTQNSNLFNTTPSVGAPYFPNYDANSTGDSQLPDTQSKFFFSSSLTRGEHFF